MTLNLNVPCACALRPGRSRAWTAREERVDVAQTVAVLTRAGTVLVAFGDRTGTAAAVRPVACDLLAALSRQI
jgi:hypothetical protein